MSTSRYYIHNNELAQVETMYRVVKWVYDDPDRAADVASKLIGWGIAIFGFACLASALRDERSARR